MSDGPATVATEAKADRRRGVTIEEAAHLLGVSINTVRRRVKKGELEVERVSTPQGYTYRVYLPGIQEGGSNEHAWAPPGRVPTWAQWHGARPDGQPSSPDGATANAPTNGPQETTLPAIREDLANIKAMLEVLARQLEEKDRQIHELHVLLQQAQQSQLMRLTSPPPARRSWWRRLLPR